MWHCQGAQRKSLAAQSSKHPQQGFPRPTSHSRRRNKTVGLTLRRNREKSWNRGPGTSNTQTYARNRGGGDLDAGVSSPEPRAIFSTRLLRPSRTFTRGARGRGSAGCERVGQASRARGERNERGTPIAHRHKLRQRFQRAHPRWRPRPPSCKRADGIPPSSFLSIS